MIRLYYGENDYALTRQVGRIRDEFTKQHGQASVTNYEADQLQLADLPQILQGQSLFHDAKLTIIHGSSTQKPLWEGLIDILEQAGEVDLLLVDNKPDKRTRTFKWLSKQAEVRQFNQLDERTTISWLQNEANQRGLELSFQLATYLTRHSGLNQWRLHHDLDKLSLADQPITKELINSLIEPNPTASVFDVMTAIIAGRQQDALAIIDIIKNYENPHMFFGLLVSQLNTLAICVTYPGRPDQQVAKETGTHPFALSQMAKIASKVDRARLDRMVEAFEQCDKRMKSSGIDNWLLIRSAIGGSV